MDASSKDNTSTPIFLLFETFVAKTIILFNPTAEIYIKKITIEIATYVLDYTPAHNSTYATWMLPPNLNRICFMSKRKIVVDKSIKHKSNRK